MIDFIKNLFKRVDYAQLVNDGAIIVDVRTKGEYQQGSVKGSINIPLSNLQNSLSRLNKNKTIITCCASGMRSGSAKRILKSRGYEEVYNGGSWASLQYKVN